MHTVRLDGIGAVRLSTRRRGSAVEVELSPAPSPPAADADQPVDVAADAAAAIARYMVAADVRRADRLRRGKPTRLRVEVSGRLDLTPGPPNQRSPLARLLRPCLEPSPDLAHLFPYQREGATWLAGREAALLADEMGLGKTIQTVTALRLLAHRGQAFRVLVACPKSLVRNWRAELGRWAPELLATAMETVDGPAPLAWQRAFSGHHVVILNYEKLRLDELARSLRIDVLVADEAHKVRNIGAAVSTGIRSVAARRRWALTGTPIERDLDDLAALLAFVDPLRFAPDDARHGAAALRSRAAPYTLRRTRDAVLDDLPSVIEHRERLELAPPQRRAYDALVRSGAKEESYLALLGRLRELCDFDPATSASSKLDRSVEILRSIIELDEKAIVFSYLLEPLRHLAAALAAAGLGDRCVLFEGALSVEQRGRVLNRFQTTAQTAVLLASTRVASEGLTLPEANHVVFLNQWWNPSANRQARDRVVRIGQKRVVHVYVFTCENTVEENLERILASKDETYRQVVDELSSSARPSPARERLAKAVVRGDALF